MLFGEDTRNDSAKILRRVAVLRACTGSREALGAKSGACVSEELQELLVRFRCHYFNFCHINRKKAIIGA